jgi:FixJ family two-component response regulator
MLTGHSEKKRVLSACDAGITEFLAKPISAKALYGLRPRPGMTVG